MAALNPTRTWAAWDRLKDRRTFWAEDARSSLSGSCAIESMVVDPLEGLRVVNVCEHGEGREREACRIGAGVVVVVRDRSVFAPEPTSGPGARGRASQRGEHRGVRPEREEITWTETTKAQSLTSRARSATAITGP